MILFRTDVFCLVSKSVKSIKRDIRDRLYHGLSCVTRRFGHTAQRTRAAVQPGVCIFKGRADLIRLDVVSVIKTFSSSHRKRKFANTAAQFVSSNAGVGVGCIGERQCPRTWWCQTDPVLFRCRRLNVMWSSVLTPSRSRILLIFVLWCFLKKNPTELQMRGNKELSRYSK